MPWHPGSLRDADSLVRVIGYILHGVSDHFAYFLNDPTHLEIKYTGIVVVLPRE